MTPTVMIQSKLDCRSRKQKRKNQPITMPGLFFGFRLRLRQSSFHWIGVISGIGRNWNRCDSADDSDFRFSLVRSAYDSDYDSDSDSAASENQPLLNSLLERPSSLTNTFKDFEGCPEVSEIDNFSNLL